MISGESCLLISSVSVAPSGSTRVSRERAASMRTLKRSFRGTSGPETELFNAGLDSTRTAWASEKEGLNNDAATARNRNATRAQGPGDMIHPFANCSEAPQRFRPHQPERLYRSYARGVARCAASATGQFLHGAVSLSMVSFLSRQFAGERVHPHAFKKTLPPGRRTYEAVCQRAKDVWHEPRITNLISSRRLPEGFSNKNQVTSGEIQR